MKRSYKEKEDGGKSAGWEDDEKNNRKIEEMDGGGR